MNDDDLRTQIAVALGWYRTAVYCDGCSARVLPGAKHGHDCQIAERLDRIMSAVDPETQALRAERDALRKRAEEAETRLAVIHADPEGANQLVQRFRAERDALRAWVLRYGQHDTSCDVICRANGSERHCTCGLYGLRQRYGQPAREGG